LLASDTASKRPRSIFRVSAGRGRTTVWTAGRTAGGDGTFEIADAVVGCSQDGGEGGAVAAGGNGPAGAVVEHDVAGEDHGQRLGVGGAGQPAEQGQRGQGSQVAAAGIHGASRISHQYCSSLSRLGS
jgi:hypothetical protein